MYKGWGKVYYAFIRALTLHSLSYIYLTCILRVSYVYGTCMVRV